MKSVLFLCLILAACSTKSILGEKVYLTKDKSKGKVVPVSKEYGEQDFYVLEKDQLPELRKASSLTYLGSDSSFHYFRVWNKLSYPEEINGAAINRNQCQVEDEKEIDNEIKFKPTHYEYHPWRHVELSDKKCFVAGWDKKKYEGAHD